MCEKVSSLKIIIIIIIIVVSAVKIKYVATIDAFPHQVVSGISAQLINTVLAMQFVAMLNARTQDAPDMLVLPKSRCESGGFRRSCCSGPSPRNDAYDSTATLGIFWWFDFWRISYRFYSHSMYSLILSS